MRTARERRRPERGGPGASEGGRWRPADPTIGPRILLCTGVLLCPIVFDRGASEPFNFPKITALWVFVVAALGLWLMEALQGRVKPVAFRLGVAGGLFLLACGVATAFSRTPVVSLFGWHYRTSGLIQYTLYVVIFFLIAQLYWPRPERLKELIYALGAASSVIVVYVIVQHLGLDPFTWGTARGSRELGKIGTLGNGNFAGGFLGATSPWLLFAFWRARSLRQRALVVGWSAITLLGLLLTESRGGLVALVLATGAAAIAFRSRFSRLVFVSGALASVLLVIVTLLLLRPSGSRPELAIPGTRNVLRMETFEFRTVWWRGALSIFAHNPLVGTGPDTFIAVFPQYFPREAATKVNRESRHVEIPDKPHNVFLDHAASMGLLGVGTFIALLTAAMIQGLRRTGQIGHRRQGDLLGVFLAFVAGYTGQAFFSIDVPPVAMIAWVGLGGVTVLADTRLVALRERGSPLPGGSRRTTALRWTAVGLVALVTAVAVVGGTRPWRADRARRAALDAARSDDFASARRSAEEAVTLYPVDTFNYLSAGSELLREADTLKGEDKRELLREAVAYFRRADEIHPNFYLVKVYIGEAASRLGAAGEPSAFYDATVAFEEASELAPSDAQVLAGYADMLNRWGRADGEPDRHCLALDKLRRAFGLGATDPKAWRSLAVTYYYLGRRGKALDAIDRSLEIDPDSRSSASLREQVLSQPVRGAAVRC